MRATSLVLHLVCFALWTAWQVGGARAQPAEGAVIAPGVASAVGPIVAFSGYVEADWQWNFARPANDITNYRGFDNRANTFTLSNVMLAASWDTHDVLGKVALQVGHTPSTYYLAEPTKPGRPGVNASDAALWKYVQEAYVGYRFHPWQRDLTLQAGVFLSPIGPESMAVHDNWNWSRSNLFFGLPFYHAGVRATQVVHEHLSLTLAVYNGWNDIVDDNPQKSVSVQALYQPSESLLVSTLYFGGVERPKDAPEGAPFRHLFDSYATFRASARVSLIAHANAGFERNRFGASRWAGAALSARLTILKQLSLAVRGDRLQEHAASDRDGSASRILFPVRWVSSGTLTLNYEPADRISFRLEYRHDAAASALYFRGRVPDSGLPNARDGNTTTVGATAWF